MYLCSYVYTLAESQITTTIITSTFVITSVVSSTNVAIVSSQMQSITESADHSTSVSIIVISNDTSRFSVITSDDLSTTIITNTDSTLINSPTVLISQSDTNIPSIGIIITTVVLVVQ